MTSLYYTLYSLPPILNIGFIEHSETDNLISIQDPKDDDISFRVDEEIDLSMFVKKVMEGVDSELWSLCSLLCGQYGEEL